MTASGTFGKYRIDRKLSRGMADVYLAWDSESQRKVVLKLIEQARDEFTRIAIEAEQRGALIQKQLHAIDPRIPQVYELGEEDGCFFVAMEYFEGRALADILGSERRLDPVRAAGYAADICSQLKTLHCFVSEIGDRRAAVIHGDIKPSNVQITAGGEPRLLDFGIAKVITATHNLTHHNLGSPTYCSPERLASAQVDFHADLWALAITLYEMIAGAPPYQAQSTRKLENLIQSRRPPRALPEECPPALAAIVNKSLAPDVSRRYASAAAFEEDLRAFVAGRPVAALQERPQSWNANATIETHAPRSVSSTRIRAPRASRPRLRIRAELGTILTALLCGMLAGLLLFIPLYSYYRLSTLSAPLRGGKDYAYADAGSLVRDWALYQEVKRENVFLSRFFPGSSLDGPMHANLIAAADNILDGFRNNSDAQLSDYNWDRARRCLEYALLIDPSDRKARGKLFLCQGYENLEQNSELPKAAASLAQFRQAAWYMPRSPDPHLGLARVYIYAYHNIGQAMAEFYLAEQLGYRSGPKEAEQQADGYLFRAQWELSRAREMKAPEDRAKWLAMAHADIERARARYEPIAGFSGVNASLQQLDEAASEQEQMEAEFVRTALVNTRARKRNISRHRWQ
jgi:serine/threonine protein kinase